MRRLALVALAAAATLLVAGSGSADTGVTGRVDSVIELSLQRTAPDRVAATVNATVAPTRLRVTQKGRPAADLETYDKPVANGRATARAAAGAPELTITYAPQSP